MSGRKRYVWGALLCIYIALVAYVCFTQPDNVPELRPDLWGIPIDKVMHFIMFLPYPVVAYGAFRPESEDLLFHLGIILVIFATGAGLAIGTEQLQRFSEYRTYEIADFYADMAGMSCSALLILIYILITKKRGTR